MKIFSEKGNRKSYSVLYTEDITSHANLPSHFVGRKPTTSFCLFCGLPYKSNGVQNLVYSTCRKDTIFFLTLLGFITKPLYFHLLHTEVWQKKRWESVFFSVSRWDSAEKFLLSGNRYSIKCPLLLYNLNAFSTPQTTSSQTAGVD